MGTENLTSPNEAVKLLRAKVEELALYPAYNATSADVALIARLLADEIAASHSALIQPAPTTTDTSGSPDR